MILRALYFLALVIFPAIFGWWLFIPMALLLAYLARLPYEIILAGLLLDLVYYFGDSFVSRHLLTVFSFPLVGLALFLDTRIYWRKMM